MRNTFLLLALLTVTVFASCTSDDDASTMIPDPSSDPIVGTWKISKIVIDGEEQTNEDECGLPITVTANADQTYVSKNYERDGEECEEFESSGTWKNLGNSRYSTDDLSGDPVNVAKVTFVNNTMITEESEELSNGEIVPLVSTFIRQ